MYYMAELQPTYGNFTLRGQVVWKDRPNAYVEDVSSSGYPYRRIRFGVKTDDKNIIQVELFQTKFDDVMLQNIETRELDKRVKYGEHYNLPEGYRLFMPINLGLEQDENGENIKKQLIPYDAIKYIDNELNNGDTVFIFGSLRFSEYKRDGNITPQVTFEPRGIYLASTKYDDEGFEGESVFNQEIILNRTEIDKKKGRLLVTAYIVNDKKGNFVTHNFYIDANKYKKFAMNVHKLKFGTKLKVEGYIHHTVEEQEVEQDDAWGESPTKAITNIVKELEITRAEKPKKEDVGFYKEDDFVKKMEEDKESIEDNPFASDSEDDWGDSSDLSDDDSFDDPFA